MITSHRFTSANSEIHMMKAIGQKGGEAMPIEELRTDVEKRLKQLKSDISRLNVDLMIVYAKGQIEALEWILEKTEERR